MKIAIFSTAIALSCIQTASAVLPATTHQIKNYPFGEGDQSQSAKPFGDKGLILSVTAGINSLHGLSKIESQDGYSELPQDKALGYSLEVGIGTPLQNNLVGLFNIAFAGANNNAHSFFGGTSATHTYSLVIFGPRLRCYLSSWYYLSLGLNFARVKNEHFDQRSMEMKITEKFSTPGYEIAIGFQKVASSTTSLYAELRYEYYFSKGKTAKVGGVNFSEYYPADITSISLVAGLCFFIPV